MPLNSPVFTATPDGILFNGLPLSKATPQILPALTLRYVKRAEQLLTTVKKEEWDHCTPHAADFIPTLAKVHMLLALASPQPFFSKYSADQPRVPPGNPDGGRWVSESVQATLSTAEHAAENVGRVLAHAVQTKEHGIIIPVNVNPDKNGDVKQANIFIGGFFDHSYGHIVQTSDTLSSTIGGNYYFTYNQQPAISDLINSLPDDMTVNVIGHSYGGDTAARVALENPDAIDTLITVDPVTTIHSKPDFSAVSDSVDNWVNVSANPQDGTETRGDFWAGFRNGHWGDAPNGIADTFVQADHHHEYFDNMMNSHSSSNAETPLQILNLSYKDTQ